MDMPPALSASRKAAFHIMHTRNCSISWYYTTFGWSIIEEKNICLFFTANQLFWPENGKKYVLCTLRASCKAHTGGEIFTLKSFCSEVHVMEGAGLIDRTRENNFKIIFTT